MTKALTALIACASLLLAAPRASFAQDTQTKNPHGSSLKEPCASCHSAKSWAPAVITPAFKHSPKRFPLEGAHQTANCRACHTSLDFKGVSTKCAVCHKDIHRGELGSDCAVCHSPRSFVDRTVMVQAHQTTRFPLTGAHVLTDCLSCHPPVAQGHMSFVGRPVECFACHVAAYDATTNPPHKSSGFPTQCEACHTTVEWGTATFDHNNTQFPLTGAHAAVTCQQCHSGGVYKGLSIACVSCHLDKYNQTTTPAHVAAGFPQDCTMCHTTATWTGAVFDHNKTAFPLTGAHISTTCAGCHGDGVYKGKPTTCVSCHQDKFTASTDPKHSAAGFATTCADCHTTVNFTSANWTHPTNLFQFTGAHVGLDCLACHGDNVFKGKGTTCATCHMANYNATTTPAHAAAGYGTNCETCHSNTSSWLGATFNHLMTWPDFTGVHATTACTACHADNVFKGKPTTCVSCHQANFNATTDPKHSAAVFATTCKDCHTTVNFTAATWTHPTNLFQFTGAHVGLDCNACHSDNVFKGKGTTCVTCHLANYNATTTPVHSTAGYGTNCESCHSSTSSWLGAVFNHLVTWPDYTGTHTSTACTACHSDNVYKGKPTTCVSCHQTNFNNTTDPKHSSAAFATTCKDCHTTVNFTTANWTHPTNLFQFTGKHVGLDCNACHADNVFKGKGTTCITCHLANYNGAADPPHAAAGFLTANCATCHNTTAFTTATWTHPTNLFQFTGAHVGLDCLQCHTTGVYKGLGTTCVTCHLANYNATTTPVHSTAGYGTGCEACHQTSTWLGATFNHLMTWPDYTGVHATTACSACHSDNVYKGKPTTCVSCHQTNYNNTTDPKHSSAVFATTCQDCHSTVNFTSSTWAHPTNLFQFTGAHVGLDCNACHADNVFKGKGTTCQTCHLTNFNATTDPVHTQAGFLAANCATCHSTVNFTTATWTHPTNLFQFTGAHVGLDCLKCHTTGVYKGLGTTCVTCHLANYNATTSPVHTAVGYGTNCESCHSSTTSWLGATFNHLLTWPDYTGAHPAVACSTCHSDNVYKGKSTLCASCHQTNYDATTDPKHSAAVFATTCKDCHTTTNFTTSSWVHPTTLFQFTGFHIGLDCNACHSDNVFKGKGTTCVTCHLTDYNGTNNPPHASAGFGTGCGTCHSTTNWLNATFTHTWFPSNHHGSTCAQCHPTNYTTFSCRGCHGDTHKKGYTDAQCYSCHAKG